MLNPLQIQANEKMKERTIYINPSHGNEPYILGGLIAKKVSEGLKKKLGGKSKIIVPHIYGSRQERILSEVGLRGIVHLDPELGKMYEPLLFRNNDFSQHLTDLIDYQEEVQRKIREHLKKEYGDIFFELNIGSKISTGALTYYAFPVIISELLERTLQEPELVRNFSQSKLEQALEIMQEVESGIQTFFIPDYHTFSYDRNRKPKQNEISTPPLKSKPKENKDDIPRMSTYFMISGTGSELEYTLKEAENLQEHGFHIIVPPWTETDKFEKRSPDVISNFNIVRVDSRAGWGTIWTCQLCEKQFVPLPYNSGDDPEIYFNVKTLYSVNQYMATEIQEKKFGTLDGLSFVADQILSDLGVSSLDAKSRNQDSKKLLVTFAVEVRNRMGFQKVGITYVSTKANTVEEARGSARKEIGEWDWGHEYSLSKEPMDIQPL